MVIAKNEKRIAQNVLHHREEWAFVFHRGLDHLDHSRFVLHHHAANDKKDLVELEEPDVINGLERFSEAEMEPFIQALRSERRDG